MKAQQIRRPHIYELDPLRACTALGVVAVHALYFTAFLNHTDAGMQIQNAIVVALHFTREVFMFVTAFALVYVYYGKPFQLKRFWFKRGIGVLLPYCIWSIVYAWLNTSNHTPLPFIQTVLLDIVTGNASYQLYYILLTLQFYIILPLFLLFLRRVSRHPWIVLVVSCLLQIGVFYADYHTIQEGVLASSSFWRFIQQYQDRFVLMYQFYFVLGGLTALYLPQVRAFLARHGRTIVCCFLLALAGLWIHFIFQVRIYGESIGYASSVLQPVMVPYSVALIACFFWFLNRWASRAQQDGKPKGYRFWHALSDASFGVYLIHALILTALLKWVVPVMPTAWPVALRVFLTWFITAGGAVLASVLLLRIPVLSRLVGRAHIPLRRSERETTPVKQDSRLRAPENFAEARNA